jgi:two-component system sensor histidine kinase CreC
MKISFSLRAFIVYFIILASLSWFILDKAIERLNVAMRQSAESVLVDTANLLAVSLQHEFNDQILDTGEIERLFSNAYERKLGAQIYRILKDEVETGVYVTDRKGVVVYDSSGEHGGEDYSQWRDVRLTLEGEYGARTSFQDQQKTEDDDEKIMVIAAPILLNEEIIGVVSVVQPIKTLEAILLDESKQLKQYAIGLLGLAMLLGYIVSHGFTAATVKLANYANDMAAGKKVRRPRFLDKRFARLSEAISRMRQQLDGKEYVEEYIHSLTHELKTPITAIRGATELMQEEMPAEERKRFLHNIQTSNQRMSRLVERMLSLARLEGMPQVTSNSEFDIVHALHQIVDEREAIIDESQVMVKLPASGQLLVTGDSLLIQQAISNLLDNALEHCTSGGEIRLSCTESSGGYQVEIFNSGDALDDFVLAKAFDRFFSLPRKGIATKSTGLGLSFVREIMNLHQGRATIKNVDDGVVTALWWPRSATSETAPLL